MIKPKSNVLFSALLFCLLSAAILIVFSGFFKENDSKWSVHFTIGCSASFTFFLSLAFAKFHGLCLPEIGISLTVKSIKQLTMGVFLGLLLVLARQLLVLLAGHYRIEGLRLPPMNTICSVLLLYILVAIREELAFRAFPLFAIHRKHGFWTAQLLIALIFSIEHIAGGMQWWEAFLGAGSGGLLFGIAAIRNGGIAFPIGLHFAINLGQWCFGLKDEPGIIITLVEPGFNDFINIASWAGYVVTVVMASATIYHHKPGISRKD